jgi:hypothetical protein
MEAFTKTELNFTVNTVMPRTKRTEELLAQKEADEQEALSKMQQDEKLRNEHETREREELLEASRKKAAEE